MSYLLGLSVTTSQHCGASNCDLDLALRTFTCWVDGQRIAFDVSVASPTQERLLWAPLKLKKADFFPLASLFPLEPRVE